jgi:hypothetical protein
VIKYSVERRKRCLNISEVGYPTMIGINRAADMNRYSEGMTVQASTFVPGRSLRQSMRRFYREFFEDFHKKSRPAVGLRTPRDSDIT